MNKAKDTYESELRDESKTIIEKIKDMSKDNNCKWLNDKISDLITKYIQKEFLKKQNLQMEKRLFLTNLENEIIFWTSKFSEKIDELKEYYESKLKSETEKRQQAEAKLGEVENELKKSKVCHFTDKKCYRCNAKRCPQYSKICLIERIQSILSK
jgi:Na+/phosphate symporter